MLRYCKSLGVLVVLWHVLCANTLAQAPKSAQFASANVPPKLTASVAVPREALRYQTQLRREAHQVWGLAAPIATFAAQIHQESRWQPEARSPVGASGLAQFMPATANWIGGLDGALAAHTPTNPAWAIRALVVYDKWLFDRLSAANPCEHMAFVLSAYNGGLGWVYKRKNLALKTGIAPAVCLGQTCALNPGVSPASQRENEHYPQVILRRIEPSYALWGKQSCVDRSRA